MDPITTFDAWVQQRRKALDITQAELADRVGCAVVTIKKIEQGTRRPSRQMAEALAQALAISDAQRETFVLMARHRYVEPRSVGDHAAVIDGDDTTHALDAMATISPPRHFVARERQMVQLATHLTGALNGSGRIVLIAGEAGYGKTTLMAEFARHALATYPDLIVAGGNCDAYAGVGNPYLPFREIMAQLTNDVETSGGARLLSQDQARRLWALLPHATQAIVDSGPDLMDGFVGGATFCRRAADHPFVTDSAVAALDALMQRQTRPGDVPQRKLFEQCAQVLRSLANRQPLLLLFDDLQWIDRASADLFLYLSRRLLGSRVLLLGTYRRSEVDLDTVSQSAREEQTPSHPIMPLIQELKRRYGDMEIDLDEWTPQAGRAFVGALLDSEPNLLGESFRTALHERTSGQPLFTVELLHDMQERGALVKDEQGRWVEGGSVDWRGLPARVEAVISQRLSRLPPVLQEALKIASVEGETFTAEVVAYILGIDGWEMVQQLSGVVSRQHKLVTGQGSRRLGEQLLSRYRFVHILFQTYLYGQLDPAERAYLHETVGQALEQLAAGQTETVAIQLAHHYQAAGLTAKAIEYFHQAGRQAVALSAHQEAIAHLTRALDLIPNLPDTLERARMELQLQIDLGVSLKITKGFPTSEVEQTYQRARVLCEQVGGMLSRASVLWGLHSVYTVRGELAMGYRYAKEGLDLVKEQRDPLLHVMGHCTEGCALEHMGRLRAAQDDLEQAWAAYSAEQHRSFISLAGIDLGVFALSHLSHSLWYRGYPDQALQRAMEAVELAQALGHPFSHASALSYLTMLHQLRADWRAVEAVATVTSRLCVENDIPYYLAWTTFMQGWAMTRQDQLEPGIAQMEQGFANLQAMRTGLRRSYYLALLAEAYGQMGRIDAGLRLLVDAFAYLYEQEELLYEPNLYRVRGELLWQQGASDEVVESCFQDGIKTAQRQEAKLSELRITMSLARLWQSQGRTGDACRLLNNVVGWFSEGLDTADMQAARKLLEAWS